MKYEDGAAITSMSVYLYYSGSDGSAAGTIVDAGNGWYRVSRSRTGSSDYISLAGFTGITAGKKIYLSGAQLEKKAYPTPVVTGFTNSGEVYDSRPATANLMIHGNVGTGASFYDSSPSKHTITSPSGAGNAPTHTNAKSKFSGGSFHFDDSDHLIITDNSEFDFGTGEFTVDFWANVDSGAIQDDTFFSNLPSGGSPPGLCLSIRETEPFSLGIYSSSGYIGNGASGNYTSRAIYTGIWYHIALVRHEGIFYFYVDGTNVGTDNRYTSLNLDSPNDFYLGRFYTDVSAYYLNGYMDEFRVTKGTALWRGGFTPPTRRNRSAPVVDLSGSNNGGNFATKDMTDVSTYRDGQVIEPVASAIWDFDGTDDHIVVNGCDLGTGGATMACWFKTSTQQTNKYLMAQGLNLTGSNGWDLDFQNTKVASYMATVSGAYSNTEYTVNYYDGKWHMLVASYNGTKNHLYYDGELVDTGGNATGGINIESTNRLTIGSWVNTPATSHITGQMAAARAYKVALTAAQIKQNFNALRSRFGV